MSQLPSVGADTFNARWLSDVQVADTFVAPQFFSKIASQGHCLIVGPRGSGKTTLLKMLQPSALSRWSGDSADEIRQKVNYCGVFIPADLNWHEQVKAAVQSQSDLERDLLSRGAITVSALHAMVDVALWRARAVQGEGERDFLKVHLSREAEAAVVKEVSIDWGLSPTVPSLLGLKHALSRALSSLGRSANAANDRTKTEEAPKVLRSPLFESTSLFAEVYNDAVSERQRQWALMFDELEIAPVDVQRELYESVRSRKPLLLLKLAFSPMAGFSQDFNFQTSGNSLGDYSEIPLWFSHRDPTTFNRDLRPFCEALWRTVDDELAKSENNPHRALSTDAGKSPETGNVRRRKQRDEVFVSLAEKDPSFASFLASKGVDPRNMDELPQDLLDSVVRKVRPLVVVRDHFRGQARAGKPTLRSRKASLPYTGAEQFFALSEGHPRWIKLTVREMLDRARYSGGRIRIPPSVQSTAVADYSDRFAALIASVGLPGASASLPIRSVYELVELIAGFFHGAIVEKDFSADPPLSFLVDSGTPEIVATGVGLALNLGAVVYMPKDNEPLFIDSVLGRRFRVSHWLAPRFGLPLTTGKQVNLSTILANSGSRSLGDTFELEFHAQ